MSNKVKSISDLLLMFHRNERPIYFISATNLPSPAKISTIRVNGSATLIV